MRNSPRHNEGLIATDFSATLGEIADANANTEDVANNHAANASHVKPSIEAELHATVSICDMTAENPTPHQGGSK